MPVTIVGGSNGTFSYGMMTWGPPAGTQVGDLLLVACTAQPAATDIPAPTGWTRIALVTHPGNNGKMAVFWKERAQGESSYTFSASGASLFSGGGIVLRGHGTPIPYASTTATSATQTNQLTLSSLTTPFDGSADVVCFGDVGTSGNTTWTPPTGLTEYVDNTSNGQSTEMAAAIVSAGATGNRTGTASASDWLAGVHLIIRPPNTAPTISPSSPADGAVTMDSTPDLSVTVTDPDLQSLTVTFQVATDSGFDNVIWTGTQNVNGPASNQSVQVTVGTTLSVDVQYWWRAKVSDGEVESAWTTPRSFWVDRSPTISWVSYPSGTILPGNVTLAWSFSDPDGHTQDSYQVTRTIGATTNWWNGTSWVGTPTWITGSANSVQVPLTGNTAVQVLTVTARDPYPAESNQLVATVTVHDPPTVTVTAPSGVLSTGGPDITVTWNYGQAQGVAQATWRVRIKAGTTVWYDSGVVSGTATSHVISDWPSNESRPTDTTGGALQAEVTVTSADGSAFTATHSLSFDLQWGVVTCDITYPPPNSIHTSSSITVTWSFSSTRGKAQGKWRVRLRQGSVLLHDSLWQPGTQASYIVPVTLMDDQSYTVDVQLQNTEGVRSS